MPCPPLRTASGTGWVAREGQRLGPPRRRRAAAGPAPAAAAQVGRAHAARSRRRRARRRRQRRPARRRSRCRRGGDRAHATPPSCSRGRGAGPTAAGARSRGDQRRAPRARPRRRRCRRYRGSSPPRMKRAEPVLEDERQQLLHPLRRRPLEEPVALPVVKVPPTLSSRRISPRLASGREGRLVDARVAVDAGPAGLQVAQRRQPAVGLRADQAQHPRLVGAEPDRDVVRRRRAALGAVRRGSTSPSTRSGAAFGGVPDRRG